MEATKHCSRCGGTGYIPNFARVDGGKCWKCTGRIVETPAERVARQAAVKASEAMTDEERVSEWNRICDERNAARRARRTA